MTMPAAVPASLVDESAVCEPSRQSSSATFAKWLMSAVTNRPRLAQNSDEKNSTSAAAIKSLEPAWRRSLGVALTSDLISMSLLIGLLVVLFADARVVASPHAATLVGWLTFVAVIVALPSVLNGFRTKNSDETSADNRSANGADALPEK